MAGHGGLTKRHSPLQKLHYQAHRTGNKVKLNKIARLRHRIRLNEAKARRRDWIKPDKGAINALKALGVTTWNN